MGAVKTTQRERFEEDTFPHLEAIWRTALWLTMRSSCAEDLVLETMAQAYRSWHRFAGTIGSKARLFRVLIREYSAPGCWTYQLNQFRSEDCEPWARDDDGSRRQPYTTVDRDEFLLLTGMSDVSVKGAIARLGVQSRLLMILFYREQFTYEDIAYITDVRRGEVKPILGKLHKLIPRYLIQCADDLMSASDSLGTVQLQKVSSDESQCGG